MEAEALLSITFDALTEARRERDAANSALFEAGVMYGDAVRQRDAARTLVRGLLAYFAIFDRVGLVIDIQDTTAIREARAAVAEWGPS